MRTSPLSNASALFVALVMIIAPAHGATIVFDPFDDNGTTDGADPQDANWSWSGNSNGGSISVVADATLDPTGVGNRVLQAYDVNGRDEYLDVRFGATALSVGEGIRASMDVRILQDPRDGLARYGVAFNSGTNNPFNGDSYGPRINLGQDTGGNGVQLLRTTASQTINPNGVGDAGGDIQLATVANYGADVGTDPFTLQFEVFRVTSSRVRIALAIDGEAVFIAFDDGTTDAGAALTEFQQFLFRSDQKDGETGGLFNFNNVHIETVDSQLVPEPASAGLLGMFGLATFMRRRRR